jgi:peptide deformylase
MDPSVQSLIEDLLVTVGDANGVGIAAPQVYEPLALFIVAPRPNPRYPHAPVMEPLALINPEIVRASDETEKGWEGCLSVPGIRGLVPRHLRIAVRFLDRRGELREMELEGFTARVFQHEFDHLNATLFIDRVETSLEFISEKEYLRLVSQG